MEAVRVPFTGYADDCTVTGQVTMLADRLSDFLSSTTEFEVEEVAARSLDDGHVVEAPSTSLLREDLCLVLATGPRGRPERRLWTRQLPVRAQVGPYVVLGYLHSPPTIDPIRAAERRAIVPLTSCVVEYTRSGEPTHETAEALLLNGSRILGITPATAADLRLAATAELQVPRDARAKDMTSDSS